MSCQYAIPLISLSDCLFLNEQVLEPTRKSNILDLIFSPDDFINSIDVTDSVLSDHRIITTKNYIPFCHPPPICKSTNRICNAFEPLDFRKADWSGLCSSIKLVNWQERLHHMTVLHQNVCLLSLRLVIYAPSMFPLNVVKINLYQSFTERKILMRKRTKLKKHHL